MAGRPDLVDELLAQARATAGLEDLGPDTYLDGLEHYCRSLVDEARLSELGTVAVHGMVTSSLVNRLRVVDWVRAHPEVTAEEIEAPVVVIGMFRAGTTFLSYLLDQDRTSRPLLRWEAGDSVPPPTPADHRRGPRVDEARAASDLLDQVNPVLRAMHHEEADGPTECVTVMSQDFRSLLWEATTNVPSYSSWLLGTDHRQTYEYHRLVLQVLQSGGVRGRWTLKSPHHAIALDALTAVYPDARLVLLHRDPVELCASVCSLIGALTGTFSDGDHRDYIARHWPAMLEESVRRIDGFRDAHPDHPVVDVQYVDLVRDPMTTVGSLYDSLGLPLGPDAEAAVRAYAEAHPKGSLGVHAYDLGSLGLDGDELTERFRPYVERYGVAR